MIERREGLDEFGKPTAVYSDKSKRDIEYTVRKRDMGSSLWRITCGTGPVPSALQGYHTDMARAEDAVVNYLKSIKTSRTLKGRQRANQSETD
jgi:hypothetical protein